MKDNLRKKSGASILKLCFGAIMLIGTLHAYCQQGSANSFEKAVDFLPPPPNAAAMIQYGNASVNKNTGTPNISIPLFTLKGYKLSTTVSLGYSSGGIKVDELASRVGMGWSLNAGGVITRTIRGKADDLNTREYPAFPIAGDNENGWHTFAYMDRVTYETNSGGRDSEPDLYNFSFDGYSGSFVTDGLKHPFLINKNGLKIEYPTTNDNWNFKIVTPDGVAYLFGGTGKVEKTKRTQSCGKSFDAYIPTAYYLSQIIHLNGETITFNYSSVDYSYASDVSETMLFSGEPYGLSGSCSVQSGICTNIVNIEGVRLTDIKSSNETIGFQYTDREDCPTDKLVSKITYTNFYNGSNHAIGSFDFNYNTVISDPSYNSSQSYLGYNKTPYLSSLVENSADNSLHKAHFFSYDHPEQRPSRLSFSQDHWGYFNGKQNSSFVPKLNNSASFAISFPNAKADREPDFAFSKKGLLQKIVYPTGGINMLFYEPNIYHEMYTESYLTKHIASCNVTGTGIYPNSEIVTKAVNFHLDVAGQVFVTFNCTGAILPAHNLGWIKIKDAVTGDYVDEHQCSPEDQGYITYEISLGAGDYQFELNAKSAEVSLSAEMKFEANQIVTTQPDKVVGGSRVSKILTTNPGEAPMVKKYYYGTHDDLNTSSLAFICGSPVYTSQVVCTNSQPSTNGFKGHILYSSSLLNLGFFNNGYISYGSVVESNGENFEGGGIETKFHTGSDWLGTLLWPIDGYTPYSFSVAEADIPNSPFSNYSSYSNAKPASEIVLKKMPGGSLQPIKRTDYFYQNKSENENIIYGYAVRKHAEDPRAYDTTFTCNPGNSDPSDPLSCPHIYYGALCNFSMVRYAVISNWVVPEYTIETTFDENGENAVQTQTDYFYENPDNFQLTRSESYNSEGKLIRTINKYPHDFINTTVYSNMVSKNYISPLISKSVVGVNPDNSAYKLSNEQTDFGQSMTDYVPIEIKNSVKGNPLVTEGTIDRRDSHGNIIQFTSKAGIVTTVVWGYDSRYPVAKVIGANTELVSDQLTIHGEDFQVLDGQALRDQLNRIRTGIPLAMVTTYTYKPGVGVTSITDPNNKTNTYEYDSFGRLLVIKDQDGNIVKMNEYNYAQPDPNAGIPIFYNEALQSDPMQCQTCAPGYGPTNDPVIYTVPAGRYYSLESQAEAHNLALYDILQNAQEYANRKGICANTAACTVEGYKFIGCGCELGSLNPLSTCSGLRTDGTWDIYRQYTFSDGSTASYIIPMPACTGADQKLLNCRCEPATKECNTAPVSNGNNSYTVNYHYHWSDGSNSSQSYIETITCSGSDKKMVGCNCETAHRHYLTATRCNINGTVCCSGDQWLCTYQYMWSNGSVGTETYTECSNADCLHPQ